MRNLTLLLLISLLLSRTSFSQTKRIAFRSHSGKAKEFTVKEEGNMGQVSKIPYYNFPERSEEYREQRRLDSLAKAEYDSLLRQNAILDSLAQARIQLEVENPQLFVAPAPVEVQVESTDVSEKREIEKAAFVDAYEVRVFPNPFSEKTAVQFSLQADQQASITIFDLSGKKAAELCNGMLEAGNYHFTWNGAGIPQGVYMVHVVIAGEGYTTKVIRQ